MDKECGKSQDPIRVEKRTIKAENETTLTRPAQGSFFEPGGKRERYGGRNAPCGPG
jgi:hypothetical protein